MILFSKLSRRVILYLYKLNVTFVFYTNSGHPESEKLTQLDNVI